MIHIHTTDYLVREGEQVDLKQRPTSVDPVYESKSRYEEMLVHSIRAELTSCSPRDRVHRLPDLASLEGGRKSSDGPPAAAVHSDALVLFRASGDLAHQQIFPSLLGLVRDGGAQADFAPPLHRR